MLMYEPSYAKLRPKFELLVSGGGWRLRAKCRHGGFAGQAVWVGTGKGGRERRYIEVAVGQEYWNFLASTFHVLPFFSC